MEWWLMSEDIRKKFLDESHERAIRRAISAATDDLVRHSKDRRMPVKDEIESRLENIEQRLSQLEAIAK